METIFLKIYSLFRERRILLFFLFSIIVVALSLSALRLHLEQDILSLILRSGEDRRTEVFEQLKVKDKVLVMIHRNDTLSIERMCEVADAVGEELSVSLKDYIEGIYYKNDGEEIETTFNFALDNLPLYLQDETLDRLDSLTADTQIEKRVKHIYESLYSPWGGFVKDFSLNDPLGLTGEVLSQMKNMQISDEYCFFSNHLFFRRDTTALIILSPLNPASDIASDRKIVEEVEKTIASIEGVEIDFFGGPAVAAYNGKQVQSDLNCTLFIALGVIFLVIFFAFRNKWSMFLILIPGIFGFLFALGIVACFKTSLSLIAIGASSAIVGVVLSYSIHVVCHKEHCESVEQLIAEMSSPLTVGSLTTIGAFFSLVFTSSSLLQDFGMLASLTIVGATFFCLIILPHIMKFDDKEENNTVLYKWVEKICDCKFENCKWLIALLVILSCFGLYWAEDSSFNADMEALCYHPEKLNEVERRLQQSVTSGNGNESIYFVATGRSKDETLEAYSQLNAKLSALVKDSMIFRHSFCPLIPPSDSVQQRKLDKWNCFFTKDRKTHISQKFISEAAKYGLPTEEIVSFFTRNYVKPVETNDIPLRGINDWLTEGNSLSMAIANIELRNADKGEIYQLFENDEKIVILDKPHFISHYVESVKDDFFFVLFVSSFIVFFALLLNYGCLETAILSFLPMTMSYLIIICFMHFFKLEFNIVSVIISTFIFGIGDDFSIFITDGLIEEYKSGRKMLAAHKTAIFFSAFVSIVGMGALIFAEHPSMKSVAQSSLIGMIAVVLIAYTIQPFLFKHLVTNRTKKNLPPFTIQNFLWTVILLGTFMVMGLVLSIVAIFVQLLPIRKIHKTNFLHYMIYSVCSVVSFIGKYRFKLEHDSANETFSKPAMVVANHQSVLDIVRILALTPKIVIMANKSNWNLPLYGLLLHLSGFFCSEDSIDETVPKLKKLVNNGYSVCVFPEGSRSVDGEISKFKSGAFYLAQALNLDLVQVVFAGHYQGINKKDILCCNRTTLSLKVLPRKNYEEKSPRKQMLESEQEIRAVYQKEKNRISTLDNPYYNYILTRNFIFKGPVLEYYTKMKLAFEDNYKQLISLVNSDSIVDIGCGYGYVSFLLSMLHPEAEITAIDYDEEKINIAKHCFIGKKINFLCKDASKTEIPKAETYILSDMLHYLSPQEQENLLQKIISQLSVGNRILIRDGNADDNKGQKWTKLSEWFSTSWLLNFNKKKGSLSFFALEDIERIVSPYNLSLDVKKCGDETSNTIYCIEKRANP